MDNGSEGACEGTVLHRQTWQGVGVEQSPPARGACSSSTQFRGRLEVGLIERAQQRGEVAIEMEEELGLCSQHQVPEVSHQGFPRIVRQYPLSKRVVPVTALQRG